MLGVERKEQVINGARCSDTSQRVAYQLCKEQSTICKNCVFPDIKVHIFYISPVHTILFERPKASNDHM